MVSAGADLRREETKMIRQVTLAVLTIFAGALQGAPVGARFSAYVDDKGAINLPKDYRTKWAHLGSWSVHDRADAGHGFHDVYTQPETVAAYRKTGKFPDGALLIKEIREVETGKLTTGKATWAGKTKAWFVMVKDTKGRFAGNPNWGNGWGWALFKAPDAGTNVSTSFRADCLRCHTPAKATDWVYVKGYPTLK
jgi:hypothetical protein